MIKKQQRKDLNDSIELSLAPKTYDASKSVKFERKEVRFKDLESTLKQYNYSLIKWKDGIRDGANSQYSDSLIVDIDKGLSIPEAEARLKAKKLDYLWLLTRISHVKQHPRRTKSGRIVTVRSHTKRTK